MGVVSGERITMAKLRELAAEANITAGLAGRPYVFLPRLLILETKEDLVKAHLGDIGEFPGAVAITKETKNAWQLTKAPYTDPANWGPAIDWFVVDTASQIAGSAAGVVWFVLETSELRIATGIGNQTRLYGSARAELDRLTSNAFAKANGSVGFFTNWPRRLSGNRVLYLSAPSDDGSSATTSHSFLYPTNTQQLTHVGRVLLFGPQIVNTIQLYRTRIFDAVYLYPFAGQLDPVTIEVDLTMAPFIMDEGKRLRFEWIIEPAEFSWRITHTEAPSWTYGPYNEDVDWDVNDPFGLIANIEHRNAAGTGTLIVTLNQGVLIPSGSAFFEVTLTGNARWTLNRLPGVNMLATKSPSLPSSAAKAIATGIWSQTEIHEHGALRAWKSYPQGDDFAHNNQGIAFIPTPIWAVPRFGGYWLLKSHYVAAIESNPKVGVLGQQVQLFAPLAEFPTKADPEKDPEYLIIPANNHAVHRIYVYRDISLPSTGAGLPNLPPGTIYRVEAARQDPETTHNIAIKLGFMKAGSFQLMGEMAIESGQQIASINPDWPVLEPLALIYQAAEVVEIAATYVQNDPRSAGSIVGPAITSHYNVLLDLVTIYKPQT